MYPYTISAPLYRIVHPYATSKGDLNQASMHSVEIHYYASGSFTVAMVMNLIGNHTTIERACYPYSSSCHTPSLTPSSTLATANMVEGDTSSSFEFIERSRFSAVSLRPLATSQNLSVLAVHNTIT